MKSLNSFIIHHSQFTIKSSLFGLKLAGMSFINGTENKYTYNGKEHYLMINDELLMVTSSKFITYNSQFNICAATDLADEFHSPYVYCANNPVMLVDPDGCEVRDANVSDLKSYNAFMKTRVGKAFYDLYTTGKYKNDIVEYKRGVFPPGECQGASGATFSGYYDKGNLVYGVAPKGVTQYHIVYINETYICDNTNNPLKFIKSVDAFLHETNHVFDFSIRGKTSEKALKNKLYVNDRANALLEVSQMNHYNFNLTLCKELTSTFSLGNE